MTKTEIPLCVYCGKPLTWNNDVLYEYSDLIIPINITVYCSKECLMKDNGLKEEDCKNYIVIRDKAKEK